MLEHQRPPGAYRVSAPVASTSGGGSPSNELPPIVVQPERLTWSATCDPDGIRDIVGVSSSDLWALEGENNLLHFDGRQWTFDYAADFPVTALYATSIDDVWAVGGNGALHYDGAAWRNVELGGRVVLESIWAPSQNDVWAVGHGEAATEIWHFDGSRFSRQWSDTTRTVTRSGIWGSSNSDIWVARGHRLLHFDGAEWFSVALPTASIKGRNISLEGVWGSAKQDVWLAGAWFGNNEDPRAHWRVMMFHFDGRHWTERQLPILRMHDQRVSQLRGQGTNVVWLVGIGFRLRFDGVRWRELQGAKGSQVATSVWVGGPKDAWLGDIGLSHWDGKFTEFPTNAPAACSQSDRIVTGLWGSKPDQLWATLGGNGDTPRLIRYDGHRWSASNLLPHKRPEFSLQGIQGTSSGDFWIVGYRARHGGDGLLTVHGSVEHITENDAHLPATGWPGRIRALGIGIGNEVYAVGAGGLVQHFDGQAWQIELVGVPQGDGWGAFADYAAKFPQASSLTKEELHAVWRTSDGDVWAAGSKGVLLHRVNSTWSSAPQVTSNALQGLWGGRGSVVWAVGDQGTILKFDGVTWQRHPSPVNDAITAVWGSADDDVWAVTDAGAVLHFAGHTWRVVKRRGPESLNGIWGTSRDDVWAFGARAILHATPH